VSAFANCGRAVAHVRGSYGPRLCENSKTLNRDRTSYSFEIVFGAHIASPFDFEIELKNIILVALRVFDFSHSLGQERTHASRSEASGSDVRSER
jgi:hypothetical protein